MSCSRKGRNVAETGTENWNQFPSSGVLGRLQLSKPLAMDLMMILQPLQSRYLGQEDHSVRKGAYSQAWQPDFNPQVPHGRTRKQTPAWGPLTSTCILWHAHMCTSMHTHTHKYNLIFFKADTWNRSINYKEKLIVLKCCIKNRIRLGRCSNSSWIYYNVPTLKIQYSKYAQIRICLAKRKKNF